MKKYFYQSTHARFLGNSLSWNRLQDIPLKMLLALCLFFFHSSSKADTQSNMQLAQLSMPSQENEKSIDQSVTNNLQIFLGGDDRFGEACYLPRSTLGQNLFPDEEENENQIAPGLESLGELSELLAQSGKNLDDARAPLKQFFSKTSIELDFTVIKKDKQLSLKEKWRGEIWMNREKDLQFSFRLGDQWISTPKECPSPEASCLVRANLSTQKGYLYNSYKAYPPQGHPFLDLLILKASRWNRWQDLYSLNFVEEKSSLYHYILEGSTDTTLHLWIKKNGTLKKWMQESERQTVEYRFRAKERTLASKRNLLDMKDSRWKILRF